MGVGMFSEPNWLEECTSVCLPLCKHPSKLQQSICGKCSRQVQRRKSMRWHNSDSPTSTSSPSSTNNSDSPSSTDSPTSIRFRGQTATATCAQLAGYCSFSFVKEQCGGTCGCPAPVPAPAPSPAGSLGTCCTCASSADCSNSMFCCPNMKKCIPSSSQSCYTHQDCLPAR